MARTKNAPPRFKAGDRIWQFDPNRRVYVDRRTGQRTHSPVYREYFRAGRVKEVLPAAYVIVTDSGSTQQVSIRSADRIYKSDAERIDMLWNYERYAIIDKLRGASLETVMAAAAAIGHVPDLEP